MNPKEIVESFWEAMQSNDFYKASTWLATNFEGYWPQSNELITGRDDFGDVNSFYPAADKWLFEINSIICEGQKVVTDVSITDGTQKARAITFHTVENGLIAKQVEFWPDDFEAPEWRSKWVKIVPDKV
ncbi:MAG: nuclear transport factor 2 family protein [Colwellia sp.]